MMCGRRRIGQRNDCRGSDVRVRAVIDVLRVMRRGGSIGARTTITEYIARTTVGCVHGRRGTHAHRVAVVHVRNQDLERAPAEGEGNAYPHQPADRES